MPTAFYAMCLISIGANLPGPDGETPLATCQAALQALACLPGINLSASSDWFETEPQPPSDQPVYVNGMACLAGWTDPARLLAELQQIEQQFGRQRSLPNAARTLDLDIIAMDDLIRQDLDPIIPHPRLHQRAFVLMPMSQVAPTWIHPILRQTTAEMLAGLAPRNKAGVLPTA